MKEGVPPFIKNKEKRSYFGISISYVKTYKKTVRNDENALIITTKENKHMNYLVIVLGTTNCSVNYHNDTGKGI